jgi:hypothetical protein
LGGNSDRLGPDNCYCVKDAREAAVKPDEQRAAPSHAQPTWRTSVKHVQLMPQHQDLDFQPPPLLETIAQEADEQDRNCNHPAIMCRFADSRQSDGWSLRKGQVISAQTIPGQNPL